MVSVFISYNTGADAVRDKQLAQQLAQSLYDKGVPVYCRASSPDTAQTQNEFFAAAREAIVLVVVGTRVSFVAEGWNKAGWNAFIESAKRGEKRVCTVINLLEGLTDDVLPAALKGCPTTYNVADAEKAVLNSAGVTAYNGYAAQPARSVPAVPAQTVPAQTVPVMAVSAQAVPAQTVPAQTAAAGKKKFPARIVVLLVTIAALLAVLAASVGSCTRAMIDPDDGDVCDYVIYVNPNHEKECLYFDVYTSDGYYYGTWRGSDKLNDLLGAMESGNLEKFSTGEYKIKKSKGLINVDFNCPQTEGGVPCELDVVLSDDYTVISGQYYTDHSLTDGDYKSTYYGYVDNGKYFSSKEILEEFWNSVG